MNTSNNNLIFNKMWNFFYTDLMIVSIFFVLSSYPDFVSSNDDYLYPVRTMLEIKNGEVEYTGVGGKTLSELSNKRYRRLVDDVTSDEQDESSSSSSSLSSSRDYMSTYYAQRKAIMDKYNSQQKAINERLERTKSLIAAKKRLRGSNTRLDVEEKENFTRPTVEIIPPSNGIQLLVDEVDSTTTTTTTTTTEISSSLSPESSTEEIILPEFDESTTFSVSFDNNNNEVGNVIESEEEVNNVFVKNESTYNHEIVTNDNGTLIIDLGGRLTDHPWRNDSASAELDRMFLWDVETEEGRLNRSNGTSEFSNYSSPGVDVRIETSPGIRVTKNLTNVQSSRTMYRNSSHEIYEIDGVVTDVKKIHDIVRADMNSTDENYINGTSQLYGGAQESEWCEDCPHDYRWGYCNGSLFYQHNIFLRNRGPSSIDAVFGMEVQGPVDVTCVEALRFNQTRGIVSLHDGGPGHDFVKLRIRGFEGEGFSYIMKVWGVNSESYNASTTPPP